MFLTILNKISFSKKNILDPVWKRAWKGVEAAYAIQQEQLANIAYLMYFNFYYTAARSNASDDLLHFINTFKMHIKNALTPWDRQKEGSEQTSRIQNLREAYKKYIGDPDDPKHQEDIRKTIEFLTTQKPSSFNEQATRTARPGRLRDKIKLNEKDNLSA